MSLWQKVSEKFERISSSYKEKTPTDATKSEAVRQAPKKAERSRFFKLLKTKDEQRILEYIATSTFELEEVDSISGFTPLLFAAKNKLWLVAEKLIEMGANIQAQTHYDKFSVFELVSEGKNIELSKRLIEMGVPIFNRKRYQIWRQPLYYAVNADSIELFEWMLEKLLREERLNYTEEAYLRNLFGECAGYAHSEAMIRCLVKHGADLNAISQETATSALVTMTRRANAPLLRVLLELGADPNQQIASPLLPIQRLTPLMISVRKGNLEVVDLLASVTNIDALSGVGPVFSEEDMPPAIMGQTALYYAVAIDAYEVAKCLMAHGPRLDILDEIGNTILQQAVKNQSIKMIDLLLPLSPDITIVNPIFKQSVLTFAEEKYPEIHKYLLANMHKQACRQPL